MAVLYRQCKILFCNRTKSNSENNTYMYTYMCTVLEIVVRHQTFPTKVNVHLNISGFVRTKCQVIQHIP